MKYMVIFQMGLGVLFAHGKDGEHVHFFSSLHVEYFVLFLATLVGGYFIYGKFFKSTK